MTTDRSMTRRRFVKHTAAGAAIPLLAAASSTLAQETRSAAAAGAAVERKLRIGVVGMGQAIAP